MNISISRRQFLGALGTGVLACGARTLLGADPTQGTLQLGMMLQGNSAVELQEKARAIAAVGFAQVQLTFFFPPTAEELQSLAKVLKELKLKTVAFGTYFNLFRPDDTGFMGSSQATMKLVATHAGLFDCKQFVTWSASYSPRFDGADDSNYTEKAVAQLRRAIEDIVLPALAPSGGRVAFEPFFRHVVGTVELAKQVLEPFPSHQVGLVLDLPNLISPSLFPKREEEFRRLFRELGDRFHLAHFKDIKLNENGQSVDYPGPGGGEMNYPWLASEIRKLNRQLPCIIEHIPVENLQMKKTKTWVESQMGIASR